MDYPAISAEERKVMTAVTNSRKANLPLTDSLHEQALALVAKGLIDLDEKGPHVPNDLLMALWANGDPL